MYSECMGSTEDHGRGLQWTKLIKKIEMYHHSGM